MKIVRYTGGSYPDIYEDGKPDYYSAHVREMERNYGVKFSDIDTVTIGNSSYPITTITFSDGLELIDEIVSTPLWCADENRQRIVEWSENLNNKVILTDDELSLVQAALHITTSGYEKHLQTYGEESLDFQTRLAIKEMKDLHWRINEDYF